MYSVTIVGGGFSGTILAAQLLLKNKDIPLKITIIEKRREVGQGVAYSTNKDYHLLNVSADKMSAISDDPGHFVKWLASKNIPLSNSGYMPRKIYSQYLNDLLKSAQNFSTTTNIEFEIIHKEATDIELFEKHARIFFNDGEFVESEKVVLALGNYPPGKFSFINENNLDNKYCGDPWSCNYIPLIKKKDTILIIGTGLTMVDTCMTLVENKHEGKIISLSKHGYLPVGHNDYSESYPPFFEEIRKETSILKIFKAIKKRIRTAAEQGFDWRSIIDSLRPYTQQIWIQIPKNEKSIFLKHLNRIWSVVRHRIPPEYFATINKLCSENQLEILSGKIIDLKNSDDGMEVEIKKRKSHSTEKINVDYIINCTGPQQNYTKINAPLVKNLLEKGLIKPGPLNLGIEAYPDGKVINDKRTDVLYTLGPPLVGVLFESTAVPELRVQAKQLAEKLLFDFKKSTERV